MSKPILDKLEKQLGKPLKDFLEERYGQGIGSVSIGKELGCDKSVVLRYMEKYGIKRCKDQHNQTVVLQKQLEQKHGDLGEFVQKELNKGREIKSIAELFDINPYTLSLWCRDWGVKVKKHPEELYRFQQQFQGRFKAFLEEQYLVQKRTIRDIGNEVRLQNDVVNVYLRYFHIPIRGRTEANQLREGLMQIEEFTYEEEQVIYGSLMGDGCVSCHRNMEDNTIQGNAWFQEGHCKKQKEYLKWKAAMLVRLGEQFYSRINERGEEELTFKTSHFEILTRLRKLFYIEESRFIKNGKKIIKERKRVTKEILEKISSPLALAIWYQDDGYFNRTNKSASIATQGFTYNEHLIMQKYFKERWNLDVLIHKTHMSKREGGFSQTRSEYWHLYFPVSETQKFFDLIRPHIHPTMLYKIGQELVVPDYVI